MGHGPDAGLSLVLISGPVCAGKSTLARALCRDGGALLLSTGRVLQRLIEPRPNPLDPGLRQTTRRDLQVLGELISTTTGGGWYLPYAAALAEGALRPVVVVDSVRAPDHVIAARASCGRVLHIHLTAPVPILAERYASRSRGNFLELSTYEEVCRDVFERGVDELGRVADLVIRTDQRSEEEAATEATGRLTRSLEGWLQKSR